MSDVDISVKPVHELLLDASGAPIRYRIAAYQRGYRWTPQQVTQLLEDILEFTKREKRPGDWYCLQPLVLRPHESGAFEVVDGQQRLTTLLLILRYFNARLTEEYRDTLYTLEYQTRPNLPSFLENPADERAEDNVDFFHIANANKTIKAWFQGHRTVVEEMKSAFLIRAKVIWYVLSPAENAVDAFTRLNVGKIPLTSGELIRALFLRGAKATQAEETRTGIAYEWDLLEKGLQRDDFWLFLRNDRGKPGPRIGFLFELVARAEGMTGTGDDYAAFYHYSRKLTDPSTDVRQVWLTIRQTYMLLDEWYEDRRLFHLAGFLIWARTDLNTLIALAAKCTKTEFQAKLRARIFSIAVGLGDLAALSPEERAALIHERLDDLEYGPNRRQIRAVLLLFNLATLLENPNSNMRFQFDSFKEADWHIEHVRYTVAADQLGKRERAAWLEHCLGYFQSMGGEEALQAEIQEFLELPATPETETAFEASTGKS